MRYGIAVGAHWCLLLLVAGGCRCSHKPLDEFCRSGFLGVGCEAPGYYLVYPNWSRCGGLAKGVRGEETVWVDLESGTVVGATVETVGGEDQGDCWMYGDVPAECEATCDYYPLRPHNECAEVPAWMDLDALGEAWDDVYNATSDDTSG